MIRPFILHIDMNSYFASVEQQANPFIRGKPVGVCAYLSRNGCIIASSKEAKKVGIKTACSIRKAKELYPDVVLVENEPAKYRSTTEKIFKIFQEYTDRVEPYSIDEAFLDMTGYIKDYEEGLYILMDIRKRIREEVGEWLTCSMGLSWTRFLAKFASDISDSDDYLIIDSKEKMIKTFDSVELQDAWGIADRMEYRLNQLGIYTLNDLRQAHPGNMMQVMGKMGYYLWAHANGVEIEGVHSQERTQPKSIGHTYCIPNQTTDLKYLFSVMMKLCERTGVRLRNKGLEAGRIYAGYSLKGGGSYFKSKRLSEPIFSSLDIFNQVKQIFEHNPPKSKVYMLAVSVSKLRPASGQMSLLYDLQKKKELVRALDTVNDRYGSFTVIPGRMWGLEDQAKDRIGFRKSVDLHEIVEDTKYEE